MSRRSILSLIGIIIGGILTVLSLLRAEKEISGRDIVNKDIRYPGHIGNPWVRLAGSILQLSVSVFIGAISISIFSERMAYGLAYAGASFLVLGGLWLGIRQKSKRIRAMTLGKTGTVLDDFFLGKNGAARGSVQIGKKRYSAYVLYKPFLKGCVVPPEKVGTLMVKKGTQVSVFEVRGVMLHLL